MIFGLEPSGDLPESWTPLEAISVVKCLSEEGHVTLYLTATAGVMPWEQVGMLDAGLQEARASMRESFEEGEDE